MITTVAQFDPTGSPSPINNSLPQGIGTWVVSNDSAIYVVFSWQGNQKVIPAGVVDELVITAPTTYVNWAPGEVLDNSFNAPVSLCSITGYSNDEKVPGVYPFSIGRLANIGNLPNAYTPTYYTGAGGNTYELPVLSFPTVVYDDYDDLTGSTLSSATAFRSKTTTSGHTVNVTSSVSNGSRANGTIYGPLGNITMFSAAPQLTTTSGLVGLATDTWIVSGLSLFSHYDIVTQLSTIIMGITSPAAQTQPQVVYTLTVGTDVIVVTLAATSAFPDGPGTAIFATATISINGIVATVTGEIDLFHNLLLRVVRSGPYVGAGLFNDSYPVDPHIIAQHQQWSFASFSAVTTFNLSRTIHATAPGGTGTCAFAMFTTPGNSVGPDSNGKIIFRPWIQAGLS